MILSMRSFEPWWIARRSEIPVWDVRYRGYGAAFRFMLCSARFSICFAADKCGCPKP